MADTEDRFLVAHARDVAYQRLPLQLRKQFAFRHFYTDELDVANGSSLSVKFLSLMIMYFCVVFKLEGRRRQYEERPSDASGRDFSQAHRRAQLVFQQLACTYSIIVMRYTAHRVLEIPTASGGVRRESSFRCASDEMVFFEMLYQLTADVVRQAFEGDASVQELAVDETNRLFRSRSFLFQSQHRSDEVARTTRELDRKASSILENTGQLADILVPQGEKLVMKYANQQRTPFLACQLPGGTSYLKYQRVKRAGGAPSQPTLAERRYKVEMTTCPFSPTHRAISSHGQRRPTTATPVPETASPISGLSKAASRQETPQPGGKGVDGTDSRRAGGSVTPLQASQLSVPGGTSSSGLRAAPSPDVEQNKSAVAKVLRSLNVPNRLVKVDEDPADAEAREALAAFERFLSRPAVEWLQTDVMPELAAIYQALANGVVVTTFTIPADLKLSYDLHGMLVLESLPE